MENICLNCGNSYKTKSKTSKYCSDKCKSKYKYNNMKKHINICKFCGKEFVSYRLDAKFCSKKCSASYCRNSGINIYQITEYIQSNMQVSVSELSKNLGVSIKTIYKIIKENGFHSYMEFVGTINGVYLEKERSDTSISALICFDLFKKAIGENYVLEKTFAGLINPKTNHKLRIDCYFPKSNIAVEYNGIQHYRYIPFYHTKNNTLEYQQYKDNIKAKYCKSNKINLIVVSYKEDLTIENINRLLSRDNQQPSTNLNG